MIAMALSCNPDLLIADEPTTALDSKVQFGIMMLLKKLQNESQMGMIFITHDLGLVYHFADEIIIMKSGKMIENGTIHQVFHHPKKEYTKKLLDCRITPIPKNQNRDEVFTSANAFPVFSANHLSVAYPLNVNFWGKAKSTRTAVDDVSFEIKSNEILGIVGESGSGKSTIAKCMVGLTQPTKGSLFFNGTYLNNIDSTIKRKIQMVFQDPYSSLHPKLTIGDAIIEAMKVNDIGNGYHDRMQKTSTLLSMVGLPAEFQEKYPHECSGGQRQRIVLARALAVEPEFLVFDESISALDAPIQKQILDLIQQLKNKLNFSAVFISHDLIAVHHLCDRILVLKEGKIIECDDADSIFFDPKHPYTKSLLEAIPIQTR
jgi:peptide/nickel transport system ATP-binding protein